MNRRIILTASLSGAIAVMFGAFGAHSLKNVVDAAAVTIWAKGVEYQFYHTFALLFLGLFAVEHDKLVKWCYTFFTLGILLFSGSLYLLATRDVFNIDFAKYIGPVTPIGGLCFIMGWIFLFLAASKRK
uniref:DUF423 domain-containing protein n=1 Tax=Pedobacter schmidteae TaxID=2201271 RepID=UPI000EB09A30|nr:DUF423 domain-containing protein [Pedobacter schmidteae]